MRLESERRESDRTAYRPLGHENRFPAFFLPLHLSLSLSLLCTGAK